MTAIAQHISGETEINITLAEGDQLYLSASGIFEDLGDGRLDGALLVDGVVEQSQLIDPIATNGLASLNFQYAYSASTSEVLNFEISSTPDSFSDTFFDYIIVSDDSENQMIVDAMGIIAGAFAFLAMLAIIMFYFKRK